MEEEARRPAKELPGTCFRFAGPVASSAAATLRLPGGATIDLDPTLKVERLRPIIHAVVEVALSKAAHDEATR